MKNLFSRRKFEGRKVDHPRTGIARLSQKKACARERARCIIIIFFVTSRVISRDESFAVDFSAITLAIEDFAKKYW